MLGNGFLGYDFGPNMDALGAAGGNAAMLEAGMAALKHEASQQQQQQQQQRLVDAHSSALLPQVWLWPLIYDSVDPMGACLSPEQP